MSEDLNYKYAEANKEFYKSLGRREAYTKLMQEAKSRNQFETYWNLCNEESERTKELSAEADRLGELLTKKGK